MKNFINCCDTKEVKKKARKIYIDYIAKLIKLHGKCIDLFVLEFVSRNTFASNLYFDILCLLSNRATFKKRLLSGVPFFVRCTARYFYSLIYILSLALFAYLTRKEQKSIPKTVDVLLDVFVLENSFNGREFLDRYFGGCFEFLLEDEKKKIGYLGTLSGVKFGKMYGVFRNMRRSDVLFIVREDYLKCSDYFRAFLLPFRVAKMKFCGLSFGGVDLTYRVQREALWSSTSTASMMGILNYCLVNRLRDSDFKIPRFINWFENQVVDHGLNAGMGDFYPGTDTIGYIGMPIPDSYLSMYPMEEEMLFKLIPQKIAVMGCGYIGVVKEFCAGLDVMVVPALRHGRLWSYMPANMSLEKKKHTVLVALPYFEKEIEQIILDTLEATKKIPRANLDVLIKFHPATDSSMFQKKFGNMLTENFSFVTGDFLAILNEADMLISSSSSTTLECIAMGKPVAVICEDPLKLINYIPKEVPEEMWRICTNSDELFDIMNLWLFSDCKNGFEKFGNDIKIKYFEHPDREGVVKMLGFN